MISLGATAGAVRGFPGDFEGKPGFRGSVVAGLAAEGGVWTTFEIGRFGTSGGADFGAEEQAAKMKIASATASKIDIFFIMNFFIKDDFILVGLVLFV